jgi:hypothetical protein
MPQAVRRMKKEVSSRPLTCREDLAGFRDGF